MKKQVLVIHGGGNFVGIPRNRLVEELSTKKVDIESLRRRSDWKTNLQEKLGEEYDVLSPRMPNPDEPHFNEWRAWFENILSILDHDIFFVGHSLGGLFLLKYCAEHTLKKNVLGLFAVAAPYVNDEEKWKGSGFALPKNFSNLAQAQKIFLYHSEDDPVVPFGDMEKFKAKIPHVSARSLTGRHHFIDDNFPEIVEDIRSF